MSVVLYMFVFVGLFDCLWSFCVFAILSLSACLHLEWRSEVEDN